MASLNHETRGEPLRKQWISCLFLVVFAATSFAAPATAKKATTAAKTPTKAAAEKVTSVEGITEYELANGLRVLLFPDPTKPTVTVNVTYLVGSRHEGYGETGMAHLLEHMLFKGTPTHTNIPQELTEHGARSNGTTWYDRTNYFETFQATDENLEVGARARGGPHGQLVHREEGSRHAR